MSSLHIIHFSTIYKVLKANEIINTNIKSSDDSGVSFLKGFMQMVACVELLCAARHR